MAEMELGVMYRQCLNRRIDDAARLRREVTAWETARNRERTQVIWRFRTADARIKLKRLYPQVQE